MLRIDTHQHFWQYDPLRDGWITDDMAAIRRDFMPADLAPILKTNGLDGCITVQSDQSEAENEFQLANAQHHDFIKGVVGWVDLQAGNIEARLEKLNQHPKLKGFRHVLQGEADRALMLKPAFLNGIKALAKYNYVYDILIFPDQLPYSIELVNQFPDQVFVLDHIAKPPIKAGEIKDWAQHIKLLAQSQNVYCKVSGMVTEADWHNWQPADFTPYLDAVFNAFGAERVMFGSDWPVCQVAGGYERVLKLVANYTAQLSAGEQQYFWGQNAIKCYHL